MATSSITKVCAGFAVILFLLVVETVHGQDAVAESNLIKALKKPYQALARPTSDGSATEIKFAVSWQNILRVKQRGKGLASVSAFVWIAMQWSDYRLRWDPKEIGVETIRLPVSKIWAPDIAFFNDVSSGANFVAQGTAVISSSGMISVVTPTSLTTQCLAGKPSGDSKESDNKEDKDSYFYKGDTQPQNDEEEEATRDWFCQFKFGSWTYDGHQLNLTMLRQEVDIDTLFQSDAFDIEELRVSRHPPPLVDITYKMKLHVSSE